MKGRSPAHAIDRGPLRDLRSARRRRLPQQRGSEPGNLRAAHDSAAHARAAACSWSRKASTRSREQARRPRGAHVLRPDHDHQPAVSDQPPALGGLQRPRRRQALPHRDHAAARDAHDRVEPRSDGQGSRLSVLRLRGRSGRGGRPRLLRPGRRRLGVVPGRGRQRLRPQRLRRQHPRQLARRQGGPARDDHAGPPQGRRRPQGREHPRHRLRGGRDQDRRQDRERPCRPGQGRDGGPRAARRRQLQRQGVRPRLWRVLHRPQGRGGGPCSRRAHRRARRPGSGGAEAALPRRCPRPPARPDPGAGARPRPRSGRRRAPGPRTGADPCHRGSRPR